MAASEFSGMVQSEELALWAITRHRFGLALSLCARDCSASSFSTQTLKVCFSSSAGSIVTVIVLEPEFSNA